MAAQSHAAFPAVPPVAQRLPQNEEELLALVQSCASKEAIRDTLVPTLFGVAEGGVQSGSSRHNRRSRQSAQGEAVLRLPNTDITSFSAEQITANTAMVVFALSARLKHARKTQSKNKQEIKSLLDVALQVFTSGDVFQLRLCGPRASMLATETLSAAKPKEKVEQIALALSSFVSRAGLSQAFWGVYGVLLEVCLVLRQYDLALPLLDVTFLDFASYGPRYLEVITFYHHLGLIHAALGNFAKATAAFVTAVSAPTAVVSAIQLLCAKRAILCGLLIDGKLIRFPPYCTGHVSRAIDRHAKEYTKLAKAFTDANWLVIVESAKSPDFTADQNGGLLNQVLDSIPRRRILAVRRHYSRMLVSDLAQRIQVAEVGLVPDLVELLHDMIESGELRAILSTSAEQDSPIVTFLDEDEDYTSPTKVREIAAMKVRADWLRSEMQRANRAMGISREYLAKQAALLEQGGGMGAKREGGLPDLVLPENEDPGISRTSGSKGLRQGAMARAIRGAGGNLFDAGF